MVEIRAALGGPGQCRGRASFRDVRLEILATDPMSVGGISVDASVSGPPLDERVYSQFIEHLGRCIYGGIWAEMLEDRKFFFPVRPDYAPYGPGVEPTPANPYPILRTSPWEIISGGPNAVAMTTHGVVSGRHAVELAPGAAIRQRHLAVEAGRRYTGYVVASSAVRGARLTVSLEGAVGGLTGAAVAGDEPRRIPFEFTATGTVASAALALRADGAPVRVGAVSLMPADRVEGMRRDTVELLRRLRAPIYRWPGGNFVSGYDWRDGIGERDRRPTCANPAWTGIEPNDSGLHEFVHFCRLVGTEPMVTVDTGFGDAHSAAAELEYSNGDARTTWWGRKRADNGAREPFNIRYWCIGNEMWGTWQLGYMKPEHYFLKHNWVVETMRQTHPSFIAIASGNAGPWSEGMLKACAAHMDWIAEHFYCGDLPGDMSHVRQIPERIRQKAEAHRAYRASIPGLRDRPIPVAMTEWNYWYGPHVFGELGTRYFLRDALGFAAGFHEYARQSDVIVSAFYAQTVNVIGAIKTSRTRAAMETTGLALELYRNRFLGSPLRTETGHLLEAQALRSSDGRRLVVSVVNPWREELRVPLRVAGARIKGPGRAWRLSGPAPTSFNDPDQDPVVSVAEVGAVELGELRLAALSATIIEFPCAAAAN